MQKEIDELIQRLETLNWKYYVAGDPEVTDLEYDRMIQQLRELEKAHPECVRAFSPTQRVGEPLSGKLAPVPHMAPMLSLDNAFDETDVRRFVRRILACDSRAHFRIEPKVDGLSVECRYDREGVFYQALTRGTGSMGEDVTAAVRTIRNLPLRVAPAGGVLQLRGEVYMPRSSFAKLNAQREKEGQDLFANPRNAAVGSLKQLDPSLVRDRLLAVLFYQVYVDGKMQWMNLSQIGAPVLIASDTPAHAGADENVHTHSIMQLLNALQQTRTTFDYDTDGAVIKAVSAEAHALGDNGRAPYWAIAFKYPPEQAQTKLLGLTFQVGRQGNITPVAELQPVQLAGTTVSRASLHNFDQVRRLDIRDGDTVIIQKAGEVIPQINGVVVTARVGNPMPVTLLGVCPSCFHSLQKVEGFVAQLCVNATCPGITLRRLEHAVSKDALDVDGVGPTAISKMFAAGARHMWQLFSAGVADLLLCGFTAASSLRMHDAFAKAKAEAKQDRILYALSLTGVGSTACEALIRAHGSVGNLVNCVSYDDIRNTPDMPPGATEAFIRWLDSPESKIAISGLVAAGFSLDVPLQEVTGTRFKDQVWVITGSLKHEREHYENIIKANGGKIGSGVTKKTTHLLLGENPGSKLRKAQEKKVPILQEDDFTKLLA